MNDKRQRPRPRCRDNMYEKRKDLLSAWNDGELYFLKK